MAATEFQIWNVYLETFCASTDALPLKINALQVNWASEVLQWTKKSTGIQQPYS